MVVCMVEKIKTAGFLWGDSYKYWENITFQGNFIYHFSRKEFRFNLGV